MKKLFSCIVAIALVLTVLPFYAIAVDSTSPSLTADYFAGSDAASRSLLSYAEFSDGNRGVSWPEGTKVIADDLAIYSYRQSMNIPAKLLGVANAADNSIRLPKSTVCIYGEAFYQRKTITDVNFNELTNLLYIDQLAFKATRLKNVDLSNTQVIRIGAHAFEQYNYYDLESFTASPNLRRIDTSAFVGQRKLENVKLNEGLEYIGDFAFNDIADCDIVVPSSVTHIGTYAFNARATLFVTAGSYAESWCIKNGYNYRNYTPGATYKGKAIDKMYNGNLTLAEIESVFPASTYQNEIYQKSYILCIKQGSAWETWCKKKSLPYIYWTQANESIPGNGLQKLENGRTLDLGKNTSLSFSRFVSTNYTGDPFAAELEVRIQKGGIVRCDQNNGYIKIYDTKYSDPMLGGLCFANNPETFEALHITAIPTVFVAFDTFTSGSMYTAGYAWRFHEDGTYHLRAGANDGALEFKLIVGSGNGGSDTEIKPPVSGAVTAVSTSSKVYVNGKSVSFEAYTIGGNNFLKLRDIAMALNGTKAQFNVTWNASRSSVDMISHHAYTAVGGEMAQGNGQAKSALPTASTIYLDGRAVDLTAYNIGDNNFFKLRDIGKALGFDVSWDNQTRTVVINSDAPYTED